MLNDSQLDAFCTDQGRVTYVLTLKSAWFIVPGGKQRKNKTTQNTIKTEKKGTQVVGISWSFLHPVTCNSYAHSVNSNYEPRI